MKNESKGMGITSMILGIMGLFFSWIPFVGLPFCVLGLIFGLVQRNWTQHGVAIAGVALNGIWVGLQVFWIAMMFIGLMAGA